MKSALIFDIKRFALHDGPGIRTTVFFKGCPLSCQWCHNPESRSSNVQQIESGRYLGDKMLPSAMVYGRELSVEAIMETIRRDEHYYSHSGGGVTLSGGEPFQQAEALLDLAIAVKEHDFHLAVDTCGYANPSKIEKLLPYVSLFLFDLKAMDPSLHKEYTGVDNSLIQQNARMIASSGVPMYIRIPVIPGVNDSENEIRSFDRFIAEIEHGVERIDLLPYHRIAAHKYRQLGMEEKLATHPLATDADLEKFERILLREGRKIKRGG